MCAFGAWQSLLQHSPLLFISQSNKCDCINRTEMYIMWRQCSCALHTTISTTIQYTGAMTKKIDWPCIRQYRNGWATINVSVSVLVQVNGKQMQVKLEIAFTATLIFISDFFVFVLCLLLFLVVCVLLAVITYSAYFACGIQAFVMHVKGQKKRKKCKTNVVNQSEEINSEWIAARRLPADMIHTRTHIVFVCFRILHRSEWVVVYSNKQNSRERN